MDDSADFVDADLSMSRQQLKHESARAVHALRLQVPFET